MNVRRAPNGVSRNSSTNEDVAENSETIIHSSNDTELSTSQMMSDLQLDQSVLASIGERLSRSAEAEHSRSITPINLSRFDGFCSPGCSLITLESRGEKIQFAAKQPRSKSMTTTPEPSTICNSDETPKKSVIRRASSVSEDHSARSSASKKSSASSESGTPVRIPIVKQRRIYIVKRMTPEVSDDEESKDVPSVSEEPTSLEPLPKRMKLSEMGMESEPIEVIKPIISPVTQVDSAENAASDGEASTEINSATLPSTPLDAAENEQLSETAHRSPVLTDGMGEEDSEVTPRITRTPVKGDTIRGEDSEEAPRITRTPAKADSMRDEDSEVAPTITRSPAKADAMAEEDSEVPPRITRPPEKADTMREESSEVTPRITRSMAAAASSKSGVGTESPAVARRRRSYVPDGSCSPRITRSKSAAKKQSSTSAGQFQRTIRTRRVRVRLEKGLRRVKMEIRLRIALSSRQRKVKLEACKQTRQRPRWLAGRPEERRRFHLLTRAQSILKKKPTHHHISLRPRRHHVVVDELFYR